MNIPGEYWKKKQKNAKNDPFRQVFGQKRVLWEKNDQYSSWNFFGKTPDHVPPVFGGGKFGHMLHFERSQAQKKNTLFFQSANSKIRLFEVSKTLENKAVCEKPLGVKSDFWFSGLGLRDSNPKFSIFLVGLRDWKFYFFDFSIP